MPSNREVAFTKEFKRNLKSLVKSYRKIKSDLRPFITAFESGELPGDQIQGIPFNVHKVRVPNTSASKGKQGGFRLLYYLLDSTEFSDVNGVGFD